MRKRKASKREKRIPEILNNNKVFVSSVHCSKCLILSEVSEIEREREKKFSLVSFWFCVTNGFKERKIFHS